MKMSNIFNYYMSEKLEVIENPILQHKQQELSEKEHPWLDEELYPQNNNDDEQATCWEKIKNGCNNFLNRTIDYFQFDRLFDVEGEKKIELRRCNKRFLENYDETYSERQMKFGYTFQYVLNEKVKEEERKEKNFCRELYRFICCEGGNEMIEIDQAYKSDREYEALIKKKIMERKKEYEEQRKEQEERKKEEEKNRVEQTKEVLRLENLQPQEEYHQNVLAFYEEPNIEEAIIVGQAQSMDIKKIKVRQERIEHHIESAEEKEIYRRQHVFNAEKKSGQIDQKTQKEKQITKTQTRTEDENPNLPDQSQPSSQNQVSIPRRTSSQFALKEKPKQGPNIQETVITKNIYHETNVYRNIYHEQNQHTRNHFKVEPEQEKVYSKTKVSKVPEKLETQERHFVQEENLEMFGNQRSVPQGKINNRARVAQQVVQEHELQENQPQIKKKKKVEKKGEQVFRSEEHVQHQRNTGQYQGSAHLQANYPPSNSQPQVQNQFIREDPDRPHLQAQGSPKVNTQNIFYASPRNEIQLQRSPNLTYDEYDNADVHVTEEENYEPVSKSKKKKRLNRVNELEEEENITQSQAFVREPSKQFQIGEQTPIEAVMFRTQTNKWKKNTPEQMLEEEAPGVMAKKKRKVKKETSRIGEIQDQQIMVEDPNDNYSNTISVDTNPGQMKASKKKRVRKQIKQEPSEEIIDQVVMDTLDFMGENNFNQESMPVSQAKAEKKRKQKGKKQKVEENFDEVIDLDL